jgi:hypothetical protein
MTPFQRVQKGVAWLNGKFPDWRSKINKDKLDIRVWGQCVLGQVIGMEALNKADSDTNFYKFLQGEFMFEHGFNVPTHEFASRKESDLNIIIQEYAKLTEEWKKVI